MPRTKQTDTERLDALHAEIKRLETLAAKKKADIQAKERRLAARRAFLLGECLLDQKNLSAALKRELAALLDAFLKKPSDREVMADWLPAHTAPAKPEPATDTAPVELPLISQSSAA